MAGLEAGPVAVAHREGSASLALRLSSEWKILRPAQQEQVDVFGLLAGNPVRCSGLEEELAPLEANQGFFPVLHGIGYSRCAVALGDLDLPEAGGVQA